MATDSFCGLGGSDGLFEGFLESAFVEMIALPDLRVGILNPSAGGENPLPIPLSIGVGIFAIEGKRQPGGAITLL